MSEAEKKNEYDLFTDYNPEHYEVSWDNYKFTGFRTVAEYSAYTKAREDEQKVCFQFLKNWNYGEINSAFGAEIQKKVEAATLPDNKDMKAPKLLEESKGQECGASWKVETFGGTLHRVSCRYCGTVLQAGYTPKCLSPEKQDESRDDQKG